jgi:hypothetical protein
LAGLAAGNGFVQSHEVFSFPASAFYTITKTESQVWGVIAMLLGVGLGTMALYRGGDLF